MLLFAPLWAVHISDGVLTRLCSLGGFLAAGLLMFLGAWRVRDEEIPRIALMTAAFFVVSLVHVPVPGGPRTHLLLNGLVGVVLGPRAALAIPLALLLQAVQFGHGGISALGVNSVVMVLPALASWLLFRALNWHPLIRRRSFRSGLVLVSTFAFALSAVYAAALLWSNHSGEDLQVAPANALLLNPLTLSITALIAVLAALWESRSANAPEFPLGLLIGEFSVLFTLFLNALALLFGGVADWQPLVLITFVVHLPLAVLEGVVLGFTVGFLARAKPELLGLPPSHQTPLRASTALRSSAVLIAGAVALALPSQAQAHNLRMSYVILPDRTIRLESWFSQGDPPRNASVRVYSKDETLLVDGTTDRKGVFEFKYTRPEPLHVILAAGQGHQAECTISQAELEHAESTSTNDPGAGTAVPDPGVAHADPFPFKDLLAGLTFILAAAAFVISLRNAQAIRRLRDGE